MTTYPGGKNGSGVYQKIISFMPPHDVYIEPFAGSAAILRAKKPARLANIAIDIDGDQTEKLRTADLPENTLIFHGDGIQFLLDTPHTQQPKTLVYLDPPYLLETRSSKRAIYHHEMMEEQQHIKLLEVILSLPCMVMISGYYSDLYATMLHGWRAESFNATTRAGVRVEWVWMNFQEPLELHDYHFLGWDYRERERIKKKQTRWKDRLTKMHPWERYALLSVLDDLRTTPS